MKLRFSPFIALLILLSACQPATPTVAPTPDCGEPGTVTVTEVAEASRGYAYALNVYLPPCYEAEAERRYPVIYLLPGRGGGPSAWFAAGANDVADESILKSGLAPFIIVTTENTDSDPQAEAILKDVIPYIDSNYRTLADRQHRAVAGGSLGGIGAYRLGWQHPDLFASIGIFGSGVISGEEVPVQSWLKALTPETAPRVFINCGFEDPLMLDRAKVTVDLLGEAGMSATTIYSSGEHATEYWVTNFPAYFKWAAQDW
jgi:S-formylglutathione hydrolase FrmB